jgi:membrane-associated HD superfamily phosphohydrolase
MPHINWLAVFAAAVSTFVLGGLWYSQALFGRAWMSVNNLSESDLSKSNMAKIFGLAFIFAMIMAANLAAFLAQPGTTAAWGATAGFLAGFGWVTLAIATIALFERRAWKYVLIHGGYMTVSFVLMGLIIGAWH